ncbi:hypothetical protein EWH21_02740 [Pseudomonas sp. REST10]|nr:hypothetical protein EWH21_02740 [Pseudomonas sp. REST10]
MNLSPFSIVPFFDTWHHHQDSGRMQLVPELIHSKTGHIGGEAMGGGM